MTTHLERRWGGSIQDPSEVEMQAALSELSKRNSEHPDCWLSSEDGWTVTASEDGRVTLENVESGEGPWHLQDQPQVAVLELWRFLKAGDIQSIRKQDWLPGYD